MAKGSVNVPGVPAKNLNAHTENKENPHSVTKKQVGLGNVPNVSTNDQTPTYSEATSLATLISGEKLSVSMGKIKKAITDLISHIANKNNPHGVTASQVGADPTGTALTLVKTHNTNTAAHSDIRELIIGLSTRLNALADSDDTTLDQLSEIVAYIKANKTLIESVTTNKISVDAIVDDLVTANSNKVLSANQGVVIKALIDELSSEKADKRWSDGTVEALSSDGITYTATIDGVTELTTGLSFVMIPQTTSTDVFPTLNVNNLGSKGVCRKLSHNTGVSIFEGSEDWLDEGAPIRVTYDGYVWVADLVCTNAEELFGTVPVEKGGTGKSSITAGNYLVGAGTDAMVEKTPAEVLADIGAAPAGYGLGVATPENEVTDCNLAVRSGWYRVSGNASNAPWTLSSWLRVDAYNENYLVQTIYNEANGGREAQRLKAGTWGEWEYENPPMVPGVEYRTTERWNGNVVYTKLIDCGYLPNSSNIGIGWGADGCCYPIRWSGAATISNSQDHKGLPYGHIGNSIQVGVTNWSIFLTTSSDYSTQKAYIQVWYTK